MSEFKHLISGLPKWLQAKVSSPPKTGDGVHQWLFTISLQLHGHLTGDQIAKVLAAAVARCGRPVDGREIRDAVNASAEVKKKNVRLGEGGVGSNFAVVKNKSPRKPKWPPVNERKRKRIITESPMTETVLSVMSPTWINEDRPGMNWFIEQLFPPTCLLCIGRSARKFATRGLGDWVHRNVQGAELIVPSPMSDFYGYTKQGKRSMHTLDNTGPRRYLVTEFDSGTADEQAALIWHLREFAPLAMVLRSGGKSLHAWWACAGMKEVEVLKFFRYAVSLGADPATWCRAQFVRIPQGWRADKQARQQVLYFDPSKLPVEGGDA